MGLNRWVLTIYIYVHLHIFESFHSRAYPRKLFKENIFQYFGGGALPPPTTHPTKIKTRVHKYTNILISTNSRIIFECIQSRHFFTSWIKQGWKISRRLSENNKEKKNYPKRISKGLWFMSLNDVCMLGCIGIWKFVKKKKYVKCYCKEGDRWVVASHITPFIEMKNYR